jgi:hypothetical protein
MFAAKKTSQNGDCLYTLGCNDHFKTENSERARLLLSNLFEESVFITFTKKPQNAFESTYQVREGLGKCLIADMERLHAAARDSDETDAVVYQVNRAVEVTILVDNNKLLPKVLSDICKN